MQFRDKDEQVLNVAVLEGINRWELVDCDEDKYRFILHLWSGNDIAVYKLTYSNPDTRDSDFNKVSIIFSRLEEGHIHATKLIRANTPTSIRGRARGKETKIQG